MDKRITLDKKQALNHTLASLTIGLVLGAGLNHNIFHPLNPVQDRAPKVLELEIPAGTAENLSKGIAPASIPASMVFLVGDTLKVKNLDSVQHQLGPMFMPAGATASMVLRSPRTYSYLCSFRPAKYFGLDVRLPDTLGTKLATILSWGLPIAAFLAIYGFVAFPRTNPQWNRSALSN